MCDSYNKQYKVNYKSLMPCNAYGINDNYDLQNSHFFPALIRKVIESIRQKKDHIKLWGDLKDLRELKFYDDIAYESIFFLNKRTHET